MSILIKGATKQQVMKVLMNSTEWLPDDIEVIEIPTPHGRLIEAPEIEWEAVGGGEKEISLGALIALAHKVDNAPTVIEAEGEDE